MGVAQVTNCLPSYQGRSQPKCNGGASQLSSTVANLYAIHQYGLIKLFTLYFLNKSVLQSTDVCSLVIRWTLRILYSVYGNLFILVHQYTKYIATSFYPYPKYVERCCCFIFCSWRHVHVSNSSQPCANILELR